MGHILLGKWAFYVNMGGIVPGVCYQALLKWLIWLGWLQVFSADDIWGKGHIPCKTGHAAVGRKPL